MTRRCAAILSLLGCLLGSSGCGPSRAAPATDDSAAVRLASSSPAATPRSTPTPTPWYLDPAEGCDFDTTVAHPDPDRLITEYLARDAAAQFLETNAWFASATECPGQEPGPDSYFVIDAYRAVPLARRADTVRMAVTSTGVASMGPFGLQPDTALPPKLVDTVTAIRTPYGWRIASPALRQVVLRAAADSFRRAHGVSGARDSFP